MSQESRNLCVICKSKYCGRPTVLEELLQLQNSSEENVTVNDRIFVSE